MNLNVEHFSKRQEYGECPLFTPVKRARLVA